MGSSDLDRYSTLMSYLQYENSMYWGRANFFLVGSTALFGFFAANLPAPSPSTEWHRVIALAVVGLAGFILTLLWHRCMWAGEFWLDRWHTLLKEIEPLAFGDRMVFRDVQRREGGPRLVHARPVARRTVYLFYCLWTGLLAYSLVLVVLKVRS